MSVNVTGLRVLVTAGASGIGRAIATTFLKQGARVHICDLSTETLAAAASELPGLGTSVTDVADPVQVDRLFDEANAHLGGLDVLVNNAGIAGPTGPVETLDIAAWDRTMAVNINSQFYCARRAVPLLKAAGGGLIVNLSSVAGLFGYPLRAPYAASKWAVIGFTKTLAMELGDFGIRVNAICPGPVEGPRIDGVIRARAEAQGEAFAVTRERYLRQNSLHTFIQAQDIADQMLYLCSPAGRKVSGQALAVDGNTESLRV
ncbi:MAG: SDR family oxidoreductase [Caldilineaceae bacterium]|nr:SDR family oxidoreductase [Caldilineaceae bacterium]